MRSTNKKWISAGTSMILGMQKFQAIGEIIDSAAEASKIDKDINLRKKFRGFETLLDGVTVVVTWSDPKTNKEWTSTMSREELNMWIMSKRRF